MSLSNSTLTVLVLISLLLALYAVVRLVRSGPRRASGGPPRAVPVDRRTDAVVEVHGKAIGRLEAAVKALTQGQRELSAESKDSVRNVGVVRFDAFEDMGGRLSFSAALLDGHGDGVVITSINGRQDTRCYAKRVQNGTSIHNLSDEERQAIREALEGNRQIVEAS